MREAAIQRPRATPRRRTRKAKKPGFLAICAAPIVRVLRAHPGRIFAIVSCATMAGSIVGNAILLQTGHHPAPLFGHASPASDTVDPTGGGAAPMPAPRPVALIPAPRVADPSAPPPAVVDAPVAPTPKATVAPPTAHRLPALPSTPARRGADPIARLLRGEDGTSALEADARVVTAQHSLAKLGFPVKPDGRMGEATRRALDTFEHDHHLVEGGELSPRLLRELSHAAGRPPG